MTTIMPNPTRAALCTVALLAFGAAGAQASVVLNFDDGTSTEDTGASALATFDFFDEGEDVRVNLSVDNTTSTEIGGYLTSIVFGLPGDTTYANDLSQTGSELTFTNSPSVNPFDNDPDTDDFDIGFGTNGQFEGGGNPNQGIAAGSTGTFSFLLDTESIMSAATLESAFATGFADGSIDAAVRFRGLADGGSDKVLYNPQPAPVNPEVVPLPAAGWLLAGGVAGLAALRRRNRA